MVFKTAMFVLITALVTGCTVYAQDRTRDFNATAPADQIRTVVVEANVGKVRLTGTDSNTARIDLRLKATSNFSLWSGREWGDVNGVELRTEVRGDQLWIGLRGERNNLSEEWTISVPARLEARVNANVGEVHVVGLTGGCDAQVQVGELEIDVPEGSIRANAGVGDVKVRTSTKSFGNVEVEAGVGDSRLIVDGHRVPSTGRRYGPGEKVSFDGPGKDRIDVKASVGDAQVTIR